MSFVSGFQTGINKRLSFDKLSGHSHLRFLQNSDSEIKLA